jgi:hypothetical protein
LPSAVADLLGYLGRNEAALVHDAVRRRQGEPIATSFVESAVDEIISWRMAKPQQMRWSRVTVQPFLDVRTAVLNDTLEDAFRCCHPAFDLSVTTTSAPQWRPDRLPRFCIIPTRFRG